MKYLLLPVAVFALSLSAQDIRAASEAPALSADFERAQSLVPASGIKTASRDAADALVIDSWEKRHIKVEFLPPSDRPATAPWVEMALSLGGVRLGTISARQNREGKFDFAHVELPGGVARFSLGGTESQHARFGRWSLTLDDDKLYLYDADTNSSVVIDEDGPVSYTQRVDERTPSVRVIMVSGGMTMREIIYYPLSYSNEARIDIADRAPGKSYVCFSPGPIHCSKIAAHVSQKKLTSLNGFNPQDFLKKSPN